VGCESCDKKFQSYLKLSPIYIKSSLNIEKSYIPRTSSTVIYDGCNSTEAWVRLAVARPVTVLAEK